MALSTLDAEIAAAGQLANKQHVDVFEQMRFQRCQVGGSRMRRDRAQVGKHTEFRSQFEQALLRSNLGIGITPFRSTHRGEKYRVAGRAQGNRLGRQGVAAGVNRRTADQAGLQDEFVTKLLGYRQQKFFSLSAHFGSDSIARQQGNGGFHWQCSSMV